MAEIYIRRIVLALAALLLFMAGLRGELGSILAAIIDTDALIEINPTTDQTTGTNIGDVQGTQTIDPTITNANDCRAAGNIWVNGRCVIPRRSGLK